MRDFSSVENVKKILNVLKPQGKYTLVRSGDFGFAHNFKITIKSVKETAWGGDPAVEIVFRSPRQKKDRKTWLVGKKSLAIFEGHVDINFNMFGEAVETSVPGVKVRKAHYMSCDSRWFTDMVAAAGKNPVYFYQGRF